MNKKKIGVIISVVLVLVLGIIAIKYINKNNLRKSTFEDQADKNKTIIVLGSEPEAITAAVNAARLGYKVEMITEDEILGGLFTKGMLTALDLNYVTGTNEILHEGFFTEFYNNASNGYNLDIIKTQEFFDKIVKHKNINLVKGVTNITPIVDTHNSNKAVGVAYTKDGKVNEVKGEYIFDGSNEAEFTRKMGAEYRTGRSEFGLPEQYAAAGVMFSVDNIDWKAISKALKEDGDSNTGVTGNAAWGFAQMYEYVPKNDLLKMRGLNISRQDDGSIVLNALLAFNVDPLNEDSYNNIIELAKQEVPLIVEYMKENLPGFENATPGKVAEDLYIREGVRIVGDYTLNGYDIIAHSIFEDTVGFGSYPSDLQTPTTEGYGNAMNGNSMYEIPLSVMLPKNIDNVIVLGRNASFDIVAHGSARTVPVLMSMAQGAVHAVDYALTNNLDLRDVRDNYMDEVHNEMKNVGKMKFPTMPANPYKGHYAESYIKYLRIKGILGSKYKDSMPLDEKADKNQINIMNALIKEHSTIVMTEEQNNYIKSMPEEITKEEYIKLASILFNKNLLTLEDLKSEGILTDEIYNIVNESEYITNAQLYVLFSQYVQSMQVEFKEEIKKEEANTIKS